MDDLVIWGILGAGTLLMSIIVTGHGLKESKEYVDSLTSEIINR